MAYYLRIINSIILELQNKDRNKELIKSQFDLMVNNFGNKLNQNKISNPYIKAQNQILKLLQIKINKTNLKLNIKEYILDCDTNYIIRYI